MSAVTGTTINLGHFYHKYNSNKRTEEGRSLRAGIVREQRQVIKAATRNRKERGED